MADKQGYWRQIPNVPESVKAFVDVQQASPGFAPPPPSFPKSVALDIKGPVGLACKAAKAAWLMEAKRAEFTGDEVSDEQLKILYRRGRQWYARHADKTDVRPPRRTLSRNCPRTMPSHVLCTCLMRCR